MIRELLHLLKESADTFEGQGDGEKVVLLVRRHIFTIIMPLSAILVAILIPPLVWALFGAQLSAWEMESLFWFASSLWYLGLWIFTFYLITMYLLNTVILTDQRIIEKEQRGFFNIKVSELHLHRVQDISIQVKGLIETFLGFGDIVVQTAAEERQFIFTRIPHPGQVKDAIMKGVVDNLASEKSAGDTINPGLNNP